MYEFNIINILSVCVVSFTLLIAFYAGYRAIKKALDNTLGKSNPDDLTEKQMQMIDARYKALVAKTTAEATTLNQAGK